METTSGWSGVKKIRYGHHTSPPPHAASLAASLKKAIVVPFSYLINEQADGRSVEVTVLLAFTLPFST